jgi:hypothetical protein
METGSTLKRRLEKVEQAKRFQQENLTIRMKLM